MDSLRKDVVSRVTNEEIGADVKVKNMITKLKEINEMLVKEGE